MIIYSWEDDNGGK